MGLGEFLAERGLLPMYGMPTRVKNLYLGLKKGSKRSGEELPEWSTIDRDIDIAISEFSPGNILTKDKTENLVIGFTGPLAEPRHKRNQGISLGEPMSDWRADKLYVAFCPTCGSANIAPELPEGEFNAMTAKIRFHPIISASSTRPPASEPRFRKTGTTKTSFASMSQRSQPFFMKEAPLTMQT